MIIHAYNDHVRLLSPEPLVVEQPQSTRVEGAGIVMQSQCYGRSGDAGGTNWRRMSIFLRAVDQDDIRALLHPFENNLAPVRRDVEVADIDVGGEARQLPLGTALQVDEP